ncbi:KH domain-containing protein [Periweissella fabaria]|nr:KH domain-containing protein [Periweissella fabaria]MCM0596640.1 KH domain-containing protein [Periweissella fabaria]
MNEEALRNLVSTIIKPLISKPDVMTITLTESTTTVSCVVSVDATDLGKLIGYGGTTIHAIRELIFSAHLSAGKKVYIEIEALKK